MATIVGIDRAAALELAKREAAQWASGEAPGTVQQWTEHELDAFIETNHAGGIDAFVTGFNEVFDASVSKVGTDPAIGGVDMTFEKITDNVA